MDRIGQVVEGKYKLLRLLGEGGMGSVYEAEHIVINRRCAVKFLHPEIASNAEVVKRFIREAQAASSIRHKGIVDIYDVGTAPEGIPDLVMEFLEGCSVGALLADRKKLPPGEAVDIVVQALSALGAAHRRGIVHRDLKPDNLYLEQMPESPATVKLLDFGIPKILLAGSPQDRMTRTGTVLGTPYYMAPEQAAGHTDVDHRADLYSMGVILYEAVTGRVPFEGENYNQLILKIFTEPFPPPRQIVPEIPEALERVILKAMARDRIERYQDAAEMIAALVPLLESRTRTSRSIPLGNTAALRHLTRTPHASLAPLGAALTATPIAQVRQATENLAPPAARSRRSLLIGIVAAAAVAVAVVVLLVARSGGENTAAAPELSAGGSPAVLPAAGPSAPPGSAGTASAPSAAVAAAAKPAAVPAPTPAPVTAPVFAPPPAGSPEAVRITLENVPPGATVSWDGAVVSEMPFLVRRGELGLVLEVQAPGFETLKRLVVPNQDRVVAVELTPVRPAAAGGRGARDAGVIAATTGPGPSPQASADAGTRPDARTTGPAKALPTFGESPW